jgi:hypothetical protein
MEAFADASLAVDAPQAVNATMTDVGIRNYSRRERQGMSPERDSPPFD